MRDLFNLVCHLYESDTNKSFKYRSQSAPFDQYHKDFSGVEHYVGVHVKSGDYNQHDIDQHKYDNFVRNHTEHGDVIHHEDGTTHTVLQHSHDHQDRHKRGTKYTRELSAKEIGDHGDKPSVGTSDNKMRIFSNTTYDHNGHSDGAEHHIKLNNASAALTHSNHDSHQYELTMNHNEKRTPKNMKDLYKISKTITARFVPPGNVVGHFPTGVREHSIARKLGFAHHRTDNDGGILVDSQFAKMNKNKELQEH